MIPHVDDNKQKTDEILEEEYDKTKEIKWYHHLLLNRPSKVVFVTVLLAVAAPSLLYHYVFFNSLDLPPSDGFSVGSCLLPRASRLLCGAANQNRTDCHSQCCFDLELNICFHRFPSRFSYIVAEPWTENMTLVPRINTVPYKLQESKTIKISMDEVSTTHLSLTYYDPKQMTVEGNRIESKNYTYNIASEELNVIVNDTRSNHLFDTIRGPTIASDNIWEIAFRLTEETMYGLGEIPLREGTVKVLYNHIDGFNDIPLIFSRVNRTYHGLLIDAVEPVQVTVVGENIIMLRCLTKVGIKLHLFTGPEPKDIARDVKLFLGVQPKLEYWMLGAHVCNDLPSEDLSADLSKFLNDATNAKIPFDSHCGLNATVFHNDQCKNDLVKENLIKGAEIVKSSKKRFVPHVSPYIMYKDSNITEASNITDVPSRTIDNCSDILDSDFMNIMLKKPDESLEAYKGSVGNESVIYPDYGSVGKFLDMLWQGIELDGSLMENSWPLDESTKFHNETYDILPYFDTYLKGAFNHTPQWNITRPNGDTHMYTHNLYGSLFAKAFSKVYNERIPIIASSQWRNGNVINRQGVDVSWTNLRKELTEIALLGASGLWLSSSPICGDTVNYNDATQIQLCVKWYAAATYLPLIKIHSQKIPRHPLAFTGTNKANIITSLTTRQSLLPYFFTTLQSGPLLRPMFYQYPFTKSLWDLQSQFNVGEDLLIVPNLQPSQSHVHLVLPPGTWYEFWSGYPLTGDEADVVTMTTTDSDFLVLIRGGSIIVKQQDVRETAEDTRLSSDYTLTVALNCIQNTTASEENFNIETCIAAGQLYVNEKITLLFEASNGKLYVKSKGEDINVFCDPQDSVWARRINQINVYGLEEELNNYDHHKNIVTSLDICLLETQDKIVFDLV